MNSLAPPAPPRYAPSMLIPNRAALWVKVIRVSRRLFAFGAFGALGVFGVALSLSGCGGEESEAPAADVGCAENAPPTSSASCISSFTPGEGAGFGMDVFPGVVFGEPRGGGELSGGLDVLSLGKGGEITIGFGGNSIIDGAGPDFIVFENAFYIGGDPAKVFKELGAVSVSQDGEVFVPFPCNNAAHPFEGCAGWRAVIASPASGVSAYDPDVSGGDPFDLADVGLGSARFVRIHDVSNSGGAPNAGFDLDAVTVVNAALP